MCVLFSDDKPVQEEDWVVCQHPECPERRRASKVRPPDLPGQLKEFDCTASAALSLAPSPPGKVSKLCFLDSLKGIVCIFGTNILICLIAESWRIESQQHPCRHKTKCSFQKLLRPHLRCLEIRRQ